MKKTFVIMLMIISAKIFSQNIINIKSDSIAANVIFEKAEKLPEYPGGINVFRQKFSRAFDVRRINSDKPMKSEAQFVIDVDGSITDIVAVGENKSMNKEMQRSIKTISKTKWKPAEIKGKPVKYRFKLPISMSI